MNYKVVKENQHQIKFSFSGLHNPLTKKIIRLSEDMNTQNDHMWSLEKRCINTSYYRGFA